MAEAGRRIVAGVGEGLVTIRAPQASDAAEWIERVAASRALHHPWLQLADTPQAFAEYLQDATDPRRERYVITRTVDDALVGFANLGEIMRGRLQQAFLGYGVFAGYERRGYTRAGLRLVVADAFGRLGLHRVEANIQPGNHASLALVASLGFTREGYSPNYLRIDGTWRDHERWAVTAETWTD